MQDLQNDWNRRKFQNFVYKFRLQALLLLLYMLLTSVCRKTRKFSTADENDDNEVFVGTTETQPLLRDDQNIRQYAANQRRPSQCPTANNTDVIVVANV